MENRVNIFQILRTENKLETAWLYNAIEVKDDPYEKTSTKGFLNPIPIEVYVIDISFEALRWKYPGQMSSGSKQIICEKRWENALKIADRIKIGDNYFKCYKDDSKGFAMLHRESYLVVVLELKNNG